MTFAFAPRTSQRHRERRNRAARLAAAPRAAQSRRERVQPRYERRSRATMLINRAANVTAAPRTLQLRHERAGLSTNVPAPSRT
jgi:hypothetical protein